MIQANNYNCSVLEKSFFWMVGGNTLALNFNYTTCMGALFFLNKSSATRFFKFGAKTLMSRIDG